MPVSKILLISLLFVGWLALSQSPKTSLYPENRNSYLIVPAHAFNRLIDETASGAVIHQRYLQLLSEINMSEFSGFVRVKKHQIGFVANQFNEGSYINRTSAYLHYAYFVTLREKTKLSLGSALGIYNLSYDGSVSGVAGSDTRPDIAVDAHFCRPRWYLYYSLKQLVSTDLRPLNAPVELKPYHEFRAGYSLEYSFRKKLYVQSHVLHYADRKDLIGLGVMMDFMPAVSGGVTAYISNTILSQVKIQFGAIKYWNTTVCASYNLAVGNSNRSAYSNSLEFGVVFSKKNVKDVYPEDKEGVKPIE